MLRTGQVISSENGQVEVQFERPEACAHCGACQGQKHCTVVKLPGSAPSGAWVDVEMPDRQVVKASMLAYALPLAALLLGMLAGRALFDGEGPMALCGVGCMAAAWLALRVIDRAMGKKRAWQPRILAVHQKGETRNGTDADPGKL